MPQLWTHYDNLQVGRGASAEVIRAAYRVLSRRYHPDTSDDPRSGEIMRVVNAAYAVLSDPERRRRHDEWIADREQTEKSSGSRRSPPTHHGGGVRHASSGLPTGAALSSPAVYKVGIGTALIASIAAIWLATTPRDEQRGDVTSAAGITAASTPSTGAQNDMSAVDATLNPNGYAAREAGDDSYPTTSIVSLDELFPPSPEEGGDAASTATRHGIADAYREAPNGQPWPTSADYVAGYPRLHTGGLSKVTIDNSRNDSAVFVKLFALEPTASEAARYLFIPGGSTFAVRDVAAGRYEVRYRDLGTGALAGTEPFAVTQSKDGTGVRFENVTLTLFTVAQGNMSLHPVSEEEF